MENGTQHSETQDARRPVSTAVVSNKVETYHLPQHDQFSFWRDYLKDIVLAEVNGAYNEEFSAKDSVFVTSSVSYAQSSVTNQWEMLRTKRQAENADSEDMCLQFCISVTETDNSFGYKGKFASGDIRIIDFNQPFSLSYNNYQAMCVMVPKKELQDRVPNLEALHGIVLDESPMASFLSSHLRSVYETIPKLNRIEAELLSDVTLEALNASLIVSARKNAVESDELSTSMIRAIRHYICKHMADSKLSPEQIAHAMGMSRSKLFRLCKPYGTPMEMVRRQRLKAARQLLLSDNKFSIEEIAYKVGYENRTSFSRAFKSEYSISAMEYMRIKQ